MKKALQLFSKEHLKAGKKMTPRQIVKFLDEFRRLQEPTAKSKLISMKISEDLLMTFKTKSASEGVKYQTQIKNLMRRWLNE